MNASSAVSPPLAISPSSQAKTTKQAMTRPSVTTGVRRVGFASRRGIIGGLGVRASWSASVSPQQTRTDRAMSWGLPPARYPGRRRGWPGGRRRVDIQTSVEGSVSTPGMMYIARRSAPVRCAAGEAVLGDVLAVDLVHGHDPFVRLVVAVDLALAPGRAGGDDRVVRGGSQEAVLGALAVQPSFLPPTKRTQGAGIGGEHVAVDERRGHLRDAPRGGQPLRRARPGSRCHPRPASRPGSAARTDRRRTGCTGRASRAAGTC